MRMLHLNFTKADEINSEINLSPYYKSARQYSYFTFKYQYCLANQKYKSTKYLLLLLFMMIILGCNKKTNNDLLENRRISEMLMERFNQSLKTQLYLDNERIIYYGGAYIDTSGFLVVRAAGDTVLSKKDIKRRIKSNSFKLESCPFPKEVAEKIFKELNSLWANDSNRRLMDSIKVHTIKLIPIANIIIVGLGDYSEKNRDLFKRKVKNSPIIYFQKAEIATAD